MMTFGHWLRGKRKERGLSQKKLAIRSGVSFDLVTRWENGHTKPTRQSFERVLRGLDVPYEEYRREIEQDGGEF